MEQQVLIYLQGLPASGKSTWANDFVKKHSNAVIVNRDKIREMLRSEYKLFPFGSKMEKLVTEIENATIYNALKQGYSVVSDNTNFRVNENTLKEMRLSFPQVKVSMLYFHIDLEHAIERDENREKTVGKDVITNMYNKYIKQ